MSVREGKTLSEWMDLDYSRRPRLLRRLSKYLGWSMLLMALLVVGWTLLPGQEQLYQAGPLSSVHAMFENDCRKCHTESFQTALRFVHADVRSAPDTACQQCHHGHVHHETQAHTTHCAQCHREHRGDHDLTRMSEQMCLHCHRDLQHGIRPGSKTQFLDVASWPQHPDFTRRWLTSDRQKAAPDPGTVKFNHYKHLKKEGVLTLSDRQVALQWQNQGDDKRVVTRQPLQCRDCHEPDSAGQFMQPINFEKHCSKCHPLSVQVAQTTTDPHLRTALQAFAQQSAPHETPEIVRGVVRERLTHLVQEHPGFLGEQPVKPARPIPGNSQTPPVTDKEFAWVNEQLKKVEDQMFRQAGWCLYCHTVASEKSVDGLPKFLPSQINTRLFPDGKESAQWFPHSRFNHETHRMVKDCTKCHQGIAVSGVTAELHMPSIGVCRECHKVGADASARTDCTECHSYHPHKW